MNDNAGVPIGRLPVKNDYATDEESAQFQPKPSNPDSKDHSQYLDAAE